jgi:Transcription factor WhiB
MTTATDLFNRALITMAQRNERPRCSDPVDHARWTSEHPADRAIAALWCTGCEVLQLCGDAAAEREEVWGVYGPRDFSIRPGRRKAA